MKTRLPIMLALIWCLTTSAAAPVRMTPVKVTDGVYMLEHSQGSGNSTVVITNDGVVVLDFHIDNADLHLRLCRGSAGRQHRDSKGEEKFADIHKLSFASVGRL